MNDKTIEIKCLDHGYVRYVDHMGTDKRIVEAARISYKSEGKGDEADKKLLEYLWKHKHTSPFEMVKITFNIKMPIFVMREYVRHRMQNLNEISGRYTQLPNEFYIPDSWRQQDLKNKQSSVKTENWNPDVMVIDGYIGEGDCFGDFPQPATSVLRKHCRESYVIYEQMLKAGVAREMARMVLPVNIYTEIYCCWDLKNLLHFINLRDDSHAQLEIQEYARAIKQVIRELFPWTLEAFEKYKFELVEQQPTP
jgi:thymidylate synthase (FAD)